MKAIQIKPIRNFLGICALSLGLVACDKDDFDNPQGDPVYTTSAQANGTQTTPPVTTSATATLIGEYNARTNNWEYRISWTGLANAASAVQVHGPAEPGIAGSMQASLVITTSGITGKAEGNIKLTEEQEAWLLADKLYFTVMNATHIEGEVRGQIYARRVQ